MLRAARVLLFLVGIGMLVAGAVTAVQGTAQPPRPTPGPAVITVLTRPHSSAVRVGVSVGSDGSLAIGVTGPQPVVATDATIGPDDRDPPAVAVALVGDARFQEPNVTKGDVQVFRDVDCFEVGYMLGTECFSSPAQVLVFAHPTSLSDLAAREFDVDAANLEELPDAGLLYGVVEGTPIGDFVEVERDRVSVITPPLQVAQEFVKVTDAGAPNPDERVVTAIDLPAATEDRTGTQFGPPAGGSTELSVSVATRDDEERRMRIDYAEPAFDIPSMRAWGSCSFDAICPSTVDSVQAVAPGSVEMSKPETARKASILLITSGLALSLGSQVALEAVTLSARAGPTAPRPDALTGRRRTWACLFGLGLVGAAKVLRRRTRGRT